MNPAALLRNLLSQATAVAGESNEVDIRVEVVRTGLLRVHIFRQDVWLNYNVLANLKVIHTFTKCRHDAGEFVA